MPKLKKIWNKNRGAIVGAGLFGGTGGLAGALLDKSRNSRGGGGGGVDVSSALGPEINDPFGSSVNNDKFRPIEGFGEFGSQRRGLGDILNDTDRVAFRGPSIEDDSAAYDAALKSAQDRAAFNEARGVENVLGGLQGRGLARSGIALKDVVSQVLGPSLMRQNELAAQFGLERANRRSDLLENQRAATREGGLRALLADQDFGNSYDLNAMQNRAAGQREQLGLAAAFQRERLAGRNRLRELDLENQINQRNAMLQRRAARRAGLTGAVGGLAGAGLGAMFGGPTGAGVGSQLGNQVGQQFGNDFYGSAYA